MKWINLLTILLLLSLFEASSQTHQNEVLIDWQNFKKDAIKKEHLGVFFEYISTKVNGKFGVSAQEIQDRGFDTEYKGMDWETKQYWFLFHSCSKDSVKESKPWYWGYNKKGLRHYVVNKLAQSGEAGFEQEILLDSGKSYEFYVYAMGNVDSVYLRFIDRNQNVIFERNLGALTKDYNWYKMMCSIPQFKKHQSCKIQIFTKSPGELHLDESSLMATDNQYTLRKEFVDMIKELKPGLMRFPGGSFCDYPTWHFYDNIGDINQRRAPNYWFIDAEIQRMDFGLDEFFKFCKELDIEPYITINYKSGSVEESLALLEYCNGDTTTNWGKLRAINGNTDPMKVKFFEIGNEQWEMFTPEYPSGYLKHYDAMVQKDKNIEVLVNGYHWNGEKEIDRVFSIVKDKAQYYSWHPGYASYPSHKLSEKDEYYLFACGSVITQNDIDLTIKALRKYDQKILQAPTEYWTQFMDLSDWITDSAEKNSSLLSGIGDINFLHSIIRNWETTGPACRTLFITYFFSDSSKDGRRVIYASPGFYAFKMFFNTYGKDFVPSIIRSTERIVPEKDNKLDFYSGAPMFEIVSTKSNDSLFISILNRSIDSAKTIFINIPGFKYGSEVRIQQLSSNSYYDRNSADEPFKVTPKSFFTKLDSTLSLPKHSYSIISVPFKTIDTTVSVSDTDKENLRIYPNPTQDYVIIASSRDTIERVELYDVIGNKIKSISEPYENEIRIDVSRFQEGVYILKCVRKNEPSYFKILKQ